MKALNRRLGVLISGRGTNLQAIIDAISNRQLDATIGVVISNRAKADGLRRARDAGIKAIYLDHRSHGDRETYDRMLVSELQAQNVGLVCLSGFMRLLTPVFLDAFPNAVLNIHPSLLPAFPGLDAQRQAWEHGVKVTGATVHFVTADLDAGPIVSQTSVPVCDDDTFDTMAARILEEEHRIYPKAIARVLDGAGIPSLG